MACAIETDNCWSPHKFFKYCVAATSISCPRNLTKEFTGGLKSEKKKDPRKEAEKGRSFPGPRD